MTIKKACTILVIFLCFLVSNAFATTYYVAVNGDDKNSGSSPTTPWKSWLGMPNWSGAAILKPGDFVYFKSTDTWNISSGYHILNVTAGVTYDGGAWGSGTRAIFRAAGQLGRGVITFLKDDPTTPTVVRGIEVDINNQSTHGVVFGAGYASNDQNGAKKIVENCILHHVGTGYYYGVYISPWNNRSISNVDILDCVVYTTPRSAINNYPGPQDGSQTHNVTIRGCEAYDAGNDTGSGGFGINIKGLCYNSIAEYNYCHDNHGGGITISGDNRTPLRAGPQEAIIRFNILSNNASKGIYIWEEGNKSAVFYGNLIFNNTGAGFYFDGSVVDDINFKVYNNTFFHNDR